MARVAKIERSTNETQISVSLDLDGTGVRSINTGIGFFDHMLDQLANHPHLVVETAAALTQVNRFVTAVNLNIH
jgi:imidazoleglycerol-phosphate dehydratase